MTQIAKEQNHLRGALDQMNERFISLENRVNTVEDRLNTVADNLNHRINEVESRLSKENREVFKWMVGMMVPVWIGILVAVIGQFIK